MLRALVQEKPLVEKALHCVYSYTGDTAYYDLLCSRCLGTDYRFVPELKAKEKVSLL